MKKRVGSMHFQDLVGVIKPQKLAPEPEQQREKVYLLFDFLSKYFLLESWKRTNILIKTLDRISIYMY